MPIKSTLTIIMCGSKVAWHERSDEVWTRDEMTVMRDCCCKIWHGTPTLKWFEVDNSFAPIIWKLQILHWLKCKNKL